MGKQKVVVMVNYAWVTEEQVYKAVVKVCLPKVYYLALHEDFRNKNYQVCGKALTSDWGGKKEVEFNNQEFLYEIQKFYNEDLSKLEQEVNDFIEKTLEIIKKVYEENRKRKAEVPQEKVLVYEFLS